MFPAGITLRIHCRSWLTGNFVRMLATSEKMQIIKCNRSWWIMPCIMRSVKTSSSPCHVILDLLKGTIQKCQKKSKHTPIVDSPVPKEIGPNSDETKCPARAKTCNCSRPQGCTWDLPGCYKPSIWGRFIPSISGDFGDGWFLALSHEFDWQRIISFE